MSFRVGERVASSSADRKRKSRQAPAEDEKAQDREADTASARKRRAALAEDEKAHDRETDTAARRCKRGSLDEDEKAHDVTAFYKPFGIWYTVKRFETNFCPKGGNVIE